VPWWLPSQPPGRRPDLMSHGVGEDVKRHSHQAQPERKHAERHRRDRRHTPRPKDRAHRCARPPSARPDRNEPTLSPDRSGNVTAQHGTPWLCSAPLLIATRNDGSPSRRRKMAATSSDGPLGQERCSRWPDPRVGHLLAGPASDRPLCPESIPAVHLVAGVAEGESKSRVPHPRAARLTADETPYDLRHRLAARFRRPRRPGGRWTGHSVEMLRRVYAGRAEGPEAVWITRMTQTLPPDKP
jgi:hypothetical protein